MTFLDAVFSEYAGKRVNNRRTLRDILEHVLDSLVFLMERVYTMYKVTTNYTCMHWAAFG